MTNAVFPVTAFVTIRPFAGESKDAHGNVVPTYGAPRLEPVYGWAANDDTENLDGRDQTEVPLDLYAPPEFTVQPRDRVVVPGVGTFEAVGHPSRHQNPFGWAPGRVLKLLRMEG